MKKYQSFHLLVGILALSVSGHVQNKVPSQSVDPHANETKSQRDARMKWWREARFGLFVHWGLYAVTAGEWKNQRSAGGFSAGAAEWLMHDVKIPVADYAALEAV